MDEIRELKMQLRNKEAEALRRDLLQKQQIEKGVHDTVKSTVDETSLTLKELIENSILDAHEKLRASLAS